MKVLVVGGLINEKKTSIGGVTKLNKDFYEYLKKNNYKVDFVQTNKFSVKFLSGVINYLFVAMRFMIKVFNCDLIIFSLSNKGVLYILPLMLLVGKAFRKKCVVRRFGGNAINYYESIDVFKRQILKYIYKCADIIFFETKYQVQYFMRFNENCFWFPNSRSKSPYSVSDSFKKKLIYIGGVRKEKGVLEILNASCFLDDDYVVHLYGPLYSDMVDVDFGKYKAKYKGVIDPENVQKIISNYNVLLLPTFWSGEGYPGVILEALSVGCPVIATNLKGIIEVVDNSCGVIIKPRDAQMLCDAIKSINDDTYKVFVCKAKKKFDNFDSDKVYNKICKIIFTNT